MAIHRSRGLIQPCPCEGSGIISVYRGLSARPEVFPLSESCDSSHLILFPSSTGERGDLAPDIGFRRSPSTWLAFPPCGGGLGQGPLFSDPIGRIGDSASAGCPAAWAARLEGFSSLTVILGFSGLPGRAGFLPGVTLCSVARGLAALHMKQEAFFLVHEVGASFPLGAAVESVGPGSRMFLFRGCPQHPFSPGNWPPGSLGGGFPHPRRGALASASSHTLSRWFLRSPSFFGLPNLGARQDPEIKGQDPFVPFGAVGLSGITAKGRLAFPSCCLHNMVATVLVGFATVRSLRNT